MIGRGQPSAVAEACTSDSAVVLTVRQNTSDLKDCCQIQFRHISKICHGLRHFEFQNGRIVLAFVEWESLKPNWCLYHGHLVQLLEINMIAIVLISVTVHFWAHDWRIIVDVRRDTSLRRRGHFARDGTGLELVISSRISNWAPELHPIRCWSSVPIIVHSKSHVAD
jgi:hypothetical protein